jgi:hypothetical protein
LRSLGYITVIDSFNKQYFLYHVGNKRAKIFIFVGHTKGDIANNVLGLSLFKGSYVSKEEISKATSGDLKLVILLCCKSFELLPYFKSKCGIGSIVETDNDILYRFYDTFFNIAKKMDYSKTVIDVILGYMKMGGIFNEDFEKIWGTIGTLNEVKIYPVPF